MKLIDILTTGIQIKTIQKILDCLGLPSKPPPISPSELEEDLAEFLN